MRQRPVIEPLHQSVILNDIRWHLRFAAGTLQAVNTRRRRPT